MTTLEIFKFENGYNNTDGDHDVCQKLIRLSFAKIVSSKRERGGAKLHRNLLILQLLQKARLENSRSNFIVDDEDSTPIEIDQEPEIIDEDQFTNFDQPSPIIDDQAYFPNCDQDEADSDSSSSSSSDEDIPDEHERLYRKRKPSTHMKPLPASKKCRSQLDTGHLNGLISVFNHGLTVNSKVSDGKASRELISTSSSSFSSTTISPVRSLSCPALVQLPYSSVVCL